MHTSGEVLARVGDVGNGGRGGLQREGFGDFGDTVEEDRVQ
jgi:hypothetical protein